MLVMCSRTTATGGELDGRPEAFDALVSHISEDIAGKMHSVSKARTLAAVAVKIEPSCANWLGM
jgi:hypothetical protein